MANDPAQTTRRHFFEQCGVGVGKIALASLLGGAATATASRPDARSNPAPHFAPTAKRVIYLFMAGAPSQLELFDNKPALKRLEGLHDIEVLLNNAAEEFLQKGGENIHKKAVARFEQLLIKRALAMTNNNQVLAARMLGISRNTLRSRIDNK